MWIPHSEMISILEEENATPGYLSYPDSKLIANTRTANCNKTRFMKTESIREAAAELQSKHINNTNHNS